MFWQRCLIGLVNTEEIKYNAIIIVPIYCLNTVSRYDNFQKYLFLGYFKATKGAFKVYLSALIENNSKTII
jgi:hypothetical protein